MQVGRVACAECGGDAALCIGGRAVEERGLGEYDHVAVFGGGTDFWFDPATVSSANPSGIGRALFAVNLLSGARVGYAQPASMSFPIAGDAMVFDVNGDGVFDRGYAGDLGGNVWRIGDDFSVQRLFSTPGHRIYYPPDAVVNAGSVNVYFGTGDRNNPLLVSVRSGAAFSPVLTRPCMATRSPSACLLNDL